MEEKTNLTFTFQARAQQHSTLSPFYLTQLAFILLAPWSTSKQEEGGGTAQCPGALPTSLPVQHGARGWGQG